MLALNEFREFLSFFPTHARADYAQFKLGMTHFYQMHSAERDQTETREAIKEFDVVRRALSRRPADRGRARRKLREARDRLSQSEYHVGYHYYRSRWYPGAVDRFKAAAREGSAVHAPRCGVLPPRRVLREGQPAGRGAALLRAADRGVRAERVPGEAQKRVELLKADDGEAGRYGARPPHRSRRFSELLNRLHLAHCEDVVEPPVVVDGRGHGGNHRDPQRDPAEHEELAADGRSRASAAGSRRPATPS